MCCILSNDFDFFSQNHQKLLLYEGKNVLLQIAPYITNQTINMTYTKSSIGDNSVVLLK